MYRHVYRHWLLSTECLSLGHMSLGHMSLGHMSLEHTSHITIIECQDARVPVVVETSSKANTVGLGHYCGTEASCTDGAIADESYLASHRIIHMSIHVSICRDICMSLHMSLHMQGAHREQGCTPIRGCFLCTCAHALA